jgi:mersacidin/lichenicidin family type 2 lantibiotic
MSTRNIIKAWKNPAYRNSLTAAERAALPANPAGSIELSDEDLGKVAGGKPIDLPSSIICPSRYVCTYLCSWIVCQA